MGQLVSSLKWIIRRTFPVVVLTVLLMVGWGLLTRPSHNLVPTGGDAGVSSWGAKVSSQNSSSEDWN